MAHGNVKIKFLFIVLSTKSVTPKNCKLQLQKQIFTSSFLKKKYQKNFQEITKYFPVLYNLQIVMQIDHFKAWS